MKKIIILALLLADLPAYAESTKNDWQNTTLSDATIEKIQQAGYQYKKCVSDEMQKPLYQQQDIRHATDEVMKQCESVLAKMREVYVAEHVPEIIADRHLKQLRIKTTRSALQNLMFAEAARKSAQPQ